MTVIRELPSHAKFFLGAVIAAGIATIGWSTMSILVGQTRPDWWVLAALTLLTGSFSLKVPTLNARISVSEAFVFLAVLLFGRNVAVLVVALDTLVLTTWLRGSGRSPLRAVFNMSAGALGIASGATVFTRALSAQPTAVPLESLIGPVLLLAITYFAVNSALVAVALGFERKSSPVAIWTRNLSWLSLNYLGGASVALLLFTYARDLNFTALAVIVPLLVIIYLTFRTSLGRLDDANKHLTQLNDLYLSTVEALAMAVDAKDQITHGHIRRVQVYAVELARRLGVTDPRQLTAIEVAALLHDMGKLAIPEHILNKPGKLTPAEFQRMKQHAGLGADLLSSIRFPYPVIPIVRHHHENWNGTGYPSAISGTDIPLGARILSVVDCFDALTSDRPYRPKLTTDAAFQILVERRGAMYDPLVVDTFIKAHPEIAPAAIRAGEEARSLITLDQFSPAEAGQGMSPLGIIRATATESTSMSSCQSALLQATSPTQAVEVAIQCLRELTPGTTFAYYRHDSADDTVICEYTSGDPLKLLNGLKMRVGERVSGWCAANKASALNSEASLDLLQIAESFQPRLKSTLSCAAATGDRLVGVITAYSGRSDAFDERHRHTFEQVSTLLAARLAAIEASSSVFPFRAGRGHRSSQ